MTAAAATPPDRDLDLDEGAGTQLVARGIVDLRGHRDHPVARVGGRSDQADARRIALLRPLAQPEARQHAGAERRRLVLGNAKAQQQRIAPHQGGDLGAGRDVLAGLDGAGLDHAGDRGAHDGVALVELGQGEGGLRLLDLGRRRGDPRPPGVDLLGAHQIRVLDVHRLATLESVLRLVRGGLGLGERGAGRPRSRAE